MESSQYCGVAGRFDDDIEIDFIVSNRGMAFIGNVKTVCLPSGLFDLTILRRRSELDLIISPRCSDSVDILREHEVDIFHDEANTLKESGVTGLYNLLS